MSLVRRHKRQTASGKTVTVRQHHRDSGSGQSERPERFLLTVRSRSGKPINAITREPEDTIMVHSRDDLERRIRAAEEDPDLVLSYRDAAPPPQASSLAPEERPEPDWSWLDGDGDAPAGDFWSEPDDDDELARATAEDAPNVIPRATRRQLKRNAAEEDKAAFREADARLQENSYREKKAGIRYETEEYLRLNDEVWRLGRKIGKW